MAAAGVESATTGYSASLLVRGDLTGQVGQQRMSPSRFDVNSTALMSLVAVSMAR